MVEVVSPLPTSPFRADVLAGKVCVITGGATGIGFGIATMFGNHGCKVAIMSRRQEVIDAAVAKLKGSGIDAFGTTVDVRDPERCVSAVNEVAAHFGRIDFLVNNAAGNFMTSAENLSPNGLATVLGIDLQGCFHMSKAALPHLKETGVQSGSVIVNITAFLQDFVTPFQMHAASAKAGIDVMTNSMGVEWAEYGIRTIGLAPGGIAGTVGGPGGRVFGNNENKTSTDKVGAAKDTAANFGEPSPTQLRKEGVPAGRFGRVEDVSLAALFMCTDAAGWITATRLTIDGGSAHRVNNFVENKNLVARKSAQQKNMFKGKGGVAKL